jgi:tetratricopeptide (TPR) repeat protein
MALSRLKQLLQFWQEDPNDPFTLYALATEYRPTDPNKALFYYEKLLAEHPGYVGTYYHAAKLYAELGQADKPRILLRKDWKSASKPASGMLTGNYRRPTGSSWTNRKTCKKADIRC